MSKSKPSVTQVIGEIYPFDPQFFIKSLGEDGFKKKREKGDLIPGGIADENGFLEYDRTMDMLSKFGTVIHQAAYDLGTIGFAPKMEGTIYEKHLIALYEFFDKYEVRAVAAEAFVETPEYCGISDGVFSLKWNGVRKNVLLDWKTYGAYKYIYGIKQELIKKDGTVNWRKDDFKKLSIQLGMYERGFKYMDQYKDVVIDDYAVAWVTQLGVFLAPVKPDLTEFEKWLANRPEPAKDVVSKTSLSL